MSEPLTVRAIFAAFGGPTPLAKALNEASGLSLTKSTVANWSNRDALPAQYDVALVAAAEARGIDLSFEGLARMRALEIAPQ